MDSKQKQKKIHSIDQLIPIVKNFPEFRDDCINERVKLKNEIQAKCDHEFINCGAIDVCPECQKIKMT